MKANIVTLIVIVLGMIFVAIQHAHEPWTAMRIAAVILGLPTAVIGAVGRGPN